MKKVLIFLYGIICYVMFLGTFLYAVFFIADLIVPKTIDSGTAGAFGQSLLIDAILLSIFAIQHTGMARPAFKKWWTRVIPKHMERSTYVLLANLSLILLFWKWRPMPDVIWSVGSQWGQAVIWALFVAGWFILLTGTFMINHFHLFGLKQVYEGLQNKQLSSPKFMSPGYYKYIRHPLMLGFIIGFWATPEMTLGHLIFSIAATGYILVALKFEEHDLITYHGDTYIEYKKRVPMLIPFSKSNKARDDKSVNFTD